MMAIVS